MFASLRHQPVPYLYQSWCPAFALCLAPFTHPALRSAAEVSSLAPLRTTCRGVDRASRPSRHGCIVPPKQSLTHKTCFSCAPSNDHLSPFCNHQGPPWGTVVNEPGGRLFGEAIRKEGERRVPFEWEAPFLGTMAASVVILTIGLGSRPVSSPMDWAREVALERTEGREESE